MSRAFFILQPRWSGFLMEGYAVNRALEFTASPNACWFNHKADCLCDPVSNHYLFSVCLEDLTSSVKLDSSSSRALILFSSCFICDSVSLLCFSISFSICAKRCALRRYWRLQCRPGRGCTGHRQHLSSSDHGILLINWWAGRKAIHYTWYEIVR